MTRLLRYLPAILVALAVAVLSLMENPDLPLVDRHSDKFWHTVMYVGVAAVFLACLLWDRRRTLPSAALAWTSAVAYGGLMELLQAYCTVSRTGDWLDLLADIAGATIGVLTTLLLYYIVCKKNCSAA